MERVPGACAVTYDADGRAIVGTDRGVVRGAEHLGDRPVVTVAVDRARARLAVGALAHEYIDPDAFVELWDLTTGRLVRELTFERGTVHAAISPDGTRIAAVGEGGACRLWAADDGRVLGERRFDGCVWGVAFSADGGRLAVGPEQGAVAILDAATLAPMGDVPGTSGAWALAFAADGALAIGGGDGCAVHAGGHTTRLPGDIAVDALFWLPDGSLAGAGDEGGERQVVVRWSPPDGAVGRGA